MGWKKLKEGIEMWEQPCLGTIKPIEGERFMALCVDSSSKKPYRGLARQVIDRKGSEDVSGFVDRSKLVIVESDDLLKWKVVGDLKINGIDKIVKKFQTDDFQFLGLEDPDIVIGEKGIKQVYFTIAYRRRNKDEFEIYLGHAFGKNLNNLTATNPVVGQEEKIWGFKELAPSPSGKKENCIHLVEVMGSEKGEPFSGIAAVRAKKLARWEFEKIVLRPWKTNRKWCQGYVSPCRILPRETIASGKLNVLIINGRAKTKELDGQEVYGDFLPGLALYNPRNGEIPWTAPEPLFKDPDATTITFASDAVPFDKEHLLLYAHVNDSFVRAYKLNLKMLQKLLPG